jgi:Putative beta-barrel porin-2, OmpL-like. bbp2
LLGYTANDDVNGIGYTTDPNVGANRYALSVGLNMVLDENTTVKTEYRLDRASQDVFKDVKTGAFKRNNSLFGASMVVAF